MAKLVVLNTGLSGRSLELTVDKTTIGRVDDNTFQIAEASVSSHHCEILLRGTDVVIKDLNSTNGTFINGEKVSETVLKPGQTLRLGQVELRLEVEGVSAPAPVIGNAPAPTAAPAPASAAPKKQDQTMVMQRGVSLNELEQGPRTGGFDTTSKAFSKKSGGKNKMFLIIGISVVAIIIVVLLVALLMIPKGQ
ncbi:MAG: FHA domain-containing protein [Akkermansiaceae bacterium]|nr:FHA domain-containing protein [Verrucomicrobiales bacterium]